MPGVERLKVPRDAKNVEGIENVKGCPSAQCTGGLEEGRKLSSGVRGRTSATNVFG